MGVSGCGKSTIGQLLSQELNIPFFDGDDFHPQSNIDKMSRGVPLKDVDRHGWLVLLNELAKKQLQVNSCIIVCSALKKSYRDILNTGIQNQAKWFYLEGRFNQILERIDKRENHFMSSNLLRSQFDTLEEPEGAFKVNISLNPEEIIEKFTNKLR